MRRQRGHVRLRVFLLLLELKLREAALFLAYVRAKPQVDRLVEMAAGGGIEVAGFDERAHLRDFMPHRNRYVAYVDPPAVLIEKLQPDTALLVNGADSCGAGGGEFEFQMTAAATRHVGGVGTFEDDAFGFGRIELLQPRFLFSGRSPGG